MNRLVDGFLSQLQASKDSSQNTVSAYRNDLSQLATHLRDSQGVTSWRDVTQDHIVNYLLHLKERGYQGSTIARKTAAAKSFFHYLVAAGERQNDPTALLTAPRVEKSAPRAMTPEEVRLLLAQPRAHGRSTPEALRDHAMLETLYSTGVRVSELVALDLDGLEFKSGRIRCMGKGGRERVLPLKSSAVAAIDAYLRDARDELNGAGDSQALFLNHRGKRLTRQGFWLIMKSYARAAGIADITPHTLRHSFATHELRQGAELRSIQHLLGHVSISTTQVYQQMERQRTARAPKTPVPAEA